MEGEREMKKVRFSLPIIFHRKKWINDSELEEIKIFGAEIGKMLSSLIKSIKNFMD